MFKKQRVTHSFAADDIIMTSSLRTPWWGLVMSTFLLRPKGLKSAAKKEGKVSIKRIHCIRIGRFGLQKWVCYEINISRVLILQIFRLKAADTIGNYSKCLLA